jgi:agmatinase
VQVGIRSLAQEEVEFLDGTDRVRTYRYWDEHVKDAIKDLPHTVYMSFDLDGFSPTLMRAVGTPEPGGLSWEGAMEILDFVFMEKDVCAFDVVELCPSDDDVVSSFAAARLVYKIMAYHAYHKLESPK